MRREDYNSRYAPPLTYWTRWSVCGCVVRLTSVITFRNHRDMLWRRYTQILVFAAMASAAQEPSRLVIEDIVISDLESGASVRSNHRFRAGDKIYLECKIAGFQIAEEPRNISLTYEIRAEDELGRLLAPPTSGTVEAEITPEDKHWRPRLRAEIEIPAYARGGKHRWVIRGADKLAGTEKTATASFTVQSAFPPPPSTLTIHGIRFFRTEGEENPVTEGQALRPGDTLFVRFFITGYKFAPNNRYEVQYGLALRDASGKVMMSAPAAAREARESFYPQEYLPCAFNVDLQKTLRRGTYKLVLSVHDSIGDQTIEAEHDFRVE